MQHIIKSFIITIIMLLATQVSYAQYNLSECQIPFQTTSTILLSGSHYSSIPKINEYGTAVCENTPNRVEQRRVSTSPGTPGPGEVQQPIGDLPIAILIGLLWIYARIRSKKA